MSKPKFYDEEKEKSVMISIKPKWCEMIASGKKTLEVRKTRPEIETPFKCYIYATKDKWEHLVQNPDKTYEIYDGKDYGKYDKSLKFEREVNGKVIGEFVCDFIYTNISLDSSETCISVSDLKKYSGGRPLYGWHISDLKIYDEPRRVEEFWRFGVKRGAKVTRPPQSWCYVESIKT